MSLVLNAAWVYLFLMVIFRVAGRRTLAKLTTFDFVLVLIISEATQQALVGNDNSLTAAAIVIVTLVGLDILFSNVRRFIPGSERWLDGSPLIIVKDGKPIDDRMKKARVDMGDVLMAARESHGIGEAGGIRYAVLEVNGEISVIPKK